MKSNGIIDKKNGDERKPVALFSKNCATVT